MDRDDKPRPTDIRVRRDTQTQDKGIDSSIWSPWPLLGALNGQDYYGRTVLEIWDSDIAVSLSFTSEKPSLRLKTIVHAVRALENASEDGLKNSPWPEDTVLGEFVGQTYRGRVVVEVWTHDSRIAVSSNGAPRDLFELAAGKLNSILNSQESLVLFPSFTSFTDP